MHRQPLRSRMGLEFQPFLSLPVWDRGRGMAYRSSVTWRRGFLPPFQKKSWSPPPLIVRSPILPCSRVFNPVHSELASTVLSRLSESSASPARASSYKLSNVPLLSLMLNPEYLFPGTLNVGPVRPAFFFFQGGPHCLFLPHPAIHTHAAVLNTWTNMHFLG